MGGGKLLDFTSSDQAIDVRLIKTWFLRNPSPSLRVLSINDAASMGAQYLGLALRFYRLTGSNIEIRDNSGSLLLTIMFNGKVAQLFLGVNSVGTHQWYSHQPNQDYA